MRFRLLGTVEIRAIDSWVRLERPRRRAVLAYLLLAANRTVTAGELAEAIWGALPPSTARTQTQNDIAAIRKALAANGHPASIVTRTGGYELITEPDDVDYHVFRRRVAAAAGAARHADWPAAADDLQAGLALWRGPVLADIVAAFVEPTRARMADQRLDAVERLAEARITMGAHDEQIPVLRELLGDHPQRERPAALLMLALHRAGRRADALAVARDLRGHLREQHGLDPSQAVVDMERRILRDAPVATVDDAVAPARGPDQLPMDVRLLAGRETQLAELSALLRRPAGDRIVLVTGTAGVGKTALAVRWGHQEGGEFPDGVLFVDLRGYDRRRPLTPLEALHRTLTGLGVDAPRLPSDPDDASALLRSLTAKGRYLVVLDNARSAEQVRPLLPGAGSCFVVVTSRDRLPGLVASHSVTRIDLPALDPADGVRILEQVIGVRRTSAEAAAAQALVDLCGGLPLAIRIVAADLCDAPDRTLARQHALLREHRLSALDNRDDPEAGVRSVLRTTYATLPQPCQRLFRLLSVLPYAEIGVVVASAADGRDQAAVQADLDRLLGVHLVERRAPGRYGFHDLPRAFAAEQADAVETAASRAAATARVLARYRELLDEASATLYPEAMRLVRGATKAAPPAAVDRLAEPADAREWLTTEYTNLLACVALAHEQGLPDAAWRLAGSLRGHQLSIGAWHDLAATASIAVTAATICGDARGEALSRLSNGDAMRRLAQHAPAIAEYDMALRLAEADDWPECQAAILGHLGIVHLRRGQLTMAADYYTRDLEICRRIGWPAAQAVALGNLGNCAYHLGQYADAVHAFEEAASLARQTSSTAVEALACLNAGTVSLEIGDAALARAYLDRALVLHGELWRTGDKITVHTELARVNCATGDLVAARRHLRRARELAERLGDASLDPSLRVQLCLSAAVVHAAGEELAQAEAALTEAVELAETYGLAFQRAGALIHLAGVLTRLGRSERARGHAATALAICQRSEFHGLTARAASLLASLPPN
ncbi:BTAD domain-containing putative transcriptional regulator [Phytohabitans sp. ZYX-F-186]|uniref:BTAD domain-containing putative transcriptional regulator n=1 Tax=Phytohabitans maris TaxID=3071409 RepID=A0ABU0ZRF5_9ACTN|nr:BTAD domain-containing putative transcriptional regulator [Phytohabitans sp. ZYX-F-186]MDQ7908919.1 BTAD domain-containing putative transcriptional regulator [Phytohabitans sp. ZYX-F-186]